MALASVLHRRKAPRSPLPAVSGTTVLDLFRDNTRLLSDRPALRHRVASRWEAITWADYGTRVREAAAGLVALGIEPGQRVGILSKNRAEWHVADLATMSAAAITVPVYHTNTATQAAYVLRHSGARVCFVERADDLAKVLLMRPELPDLERVVMFEGNDGFDDDFVVGLAALRDIGARHLETAPDAVDARVRSVGPDDVATIVYTSGTTGPPKGVLITHGNVIATVRSITEIVSIGPEDRFLSFLPLSHIAERVVSDFGQIVAGGETWFAQSLATVQSDLTACRPTIFFAVPRVWEKFHDGILDALETRPSPLRSLAARHLELGEQLVDARQAGLRVPLRQRLTHVALDRLVGVAIRRELGLDQAHIVVSGAAPIHPDLVRWFHAIGLPIAEVYGQTEDCGPTTLNPPDRVKIGTVGPPIPGVEVRIADDGEILVKGPNVCAGYLDDEAATAELIDDVGWMHSGDLGVLDDDGYLVITGRKKDLIVNAAGKNIAPQAIEVDLQHEPLVSQAVIVGDRRPYLVALLALDSEALAGWALEHGKSFDLEALADDPDVREELAAAVGRVNQRRSPVEQIKKWRVLPGELTLAENELTPTLKVKREVVADHHVEMIEEMYAR